MAYGVIEGSVDAGSPINLFEFIYGTAPGDVYRYATTSETIVAAGRAWEPFNIEHGPITSAGDLDRAELVLTTPVDIPVAKLFLITPPSREVILNIWRGHALEDGLDDFMRIWTGRVLTPTWADSQLELTCEPVATSLKRIGLRRYYQYGCGHVLYGPICRANRGANTATGYISRVVDAQTVEITLTVEPVGFVHTRLVGGTFRYEPLSGTRGLRTVTGVSLIPGGVRLRLMSAIVGMQVNASADASYGCKHNWAACQGFANTPNYGGFPNIPTKDPFRTNTF